MARCCSRSVVRSTASTRSQAAYTNELIFGVSHQASADWQMSANFIYRKDENLFNTVDVGVADETYTPTPYDDPRAGRRPGNR